MLQVVRGQRVWVGILPPRDPNEPQRTAGTIEPMAYVPGVVFDPTPAPRTVIRRGGSRVIQNAVDVVTFHVLDNGARTFYKRQGQGLIGLSPRDKYIPAIDGPNDEFVTTGWARTLSQLAAESLSALVADPDEAKIKEAEDLYASIAAPEVTPA